MRSVVELRPSPSGLRGPRRHGVRRHGVRRVRPVRRAVAAL